MNAQTRSPELVHKMDAYWRAANYLSVGQIYPSDNPLLKRPLALADVKRMPLGHWGTTPGQNFIDLHLNRVIKQYDLDMIYVSNLRTRRAETHRGGGCRRDHVGRSCRRQTKRQSGAGQRLGRHLSCAVAIVCVTTDVTRHNEDEDD